MEPRCGSRILICVILVLLSVTITGGREFKCFTCTYSGIIGNPDFLCVHTPDKVQTGSITDTCNVSCLFQAQYVIETNAVLSLYRGCGQEGGRDECSDNLGLHTCLKYCTTAFCNGKPAIYPEPTSPPPEVEGDPNNGYKERPPCSRVPKYPEDDDVQVDCDPDSKSELFGLSVWVERSGAVRNHCCFLTWLATVAFLSPLL